MLFLAGVKLGSGVKLSTELHVIMNVKQELACDIAITVMSQMKFAVIDTLVGNQNFLNSQFTTLFRTILKTIADQSS